ncbi:MAG: ABC transporter permease [Peptococcia bacterium]
MLRITKRDELPQVARVAIRIGAVVLALLFSALLIMALDLSPLEVYGALVDGAFGTAYRVRETIIKGIPLIITSLGMCIAFRMRFWNIGGEGQITMGAFAASFVALQFPDMPRIVLLPLMMVAGIIGGGLWAIIPAFFRARWRTNETIVTLMMNYIAIKWITYLQYGPWKDPNALGFPKIPNFTTNAILPKVGGVHIGWIITLVLVVLVHIFLTRTKKGYEIAVLGESENTALYAGINIKKTIISTIFISGAICGLTGMIQASAVSNTLTFGIAGGVGFTAIITTWLAALKAPLVMVVSILFAGLIQGGSYIQTAFGISQAAAEMLQGMILFFVLGSEFFTRYKIHWTKPVAHHNNKEAEL